jgi:DNA-directed RNA polymerase I subunit RPA49
MDFAVDYSADGASAPLVIGSSKTCTYENNGVNEGDSIDPLLTTFVAVYDKTANKITVHAAPKPTTAVQPLYQTVTAYVPAVSATAGSLQERRNNLYQSFGSSKKLKVLKSQAANKVDIGTVVDGHKMLDNMDGQDQSASNREAMEASKSGEAESNVVDRAMEEARRAFLPPYDVTATKPEEVYDAEDMVGADAWGQISRVVSAVSHKEDWRSALTGNGTFNGINAYPESIITQLALLPDDLDGSSSDKRRAKILVFLRHVMVFHENVKKMGRKTPEEFGKAVGIPEVAVVQILKLFSTEGTSGGYGFTKQLEDKRMLWMMLLFILGAGGKKCKVADIGGLLSDLHVDVKVAGELLRQAGCVAKKGAGGVSAELKVPLVFPGPKRGKK